MSDEQPAGERRGTESGAPDLGPSVDVELGDETRELLVQGDTEAALRRHDGSQRQEPEADDERVTGDLGGAAGDQEGGAG
jgi:hypothetical protein